MSLRPSTAYTYEGMIRLYVVPTLGHHKLQALIGADLNRMYADLLGKGRTETRCGLGPDSP